MSNEVHQRNLFAAMVVQGVMANSGYPGCGTTEGQRADFARKVSQFAIMISDQLIIQLNATEKVRK